MGAFSQAGRRTRRRTAALALALGLGAVLGLLLPGPGRALAAAQPGSSFSFSAGWPSCAIEAGKAYCWAPGSVPVAVNTRGVLNGKTLTQISTGPGYACALDTSGAAYCWGANQWGQLGFGVLGSSVVPVPVDTKGVLAGKKLVRISAAEQEACALDSTGHAYCWGLNTGGELGDGGTANSDIPVAVDTSGALAGKRLTQISAGNAYACAVDTTGAAYCWGFGHNGELGNGGSTSSSVPVSVDASGVLAGKKLVGISASELGGSTCAVDAGGSAYCWGENLEGQLGDDSTNGSAVPVAVDTSGVLTGKTLTQVTAGSVYTCALDSAGAAYCWGDNLQGQLGDNSRDSSAVPVAVDTSGALAGKALTQVSAGGLSLACAMSTSGAVYCWGSPDNVSAGSTVPVAVGPSPVTGVTAASGNRAAKVSWQVPVMSAGVTGYTAIAKPGEKICITKSTSCTIGGLTNDVTYSVTVVAHTARTNSSASVPVAVTPGSHVAFVSNPFATAAFGTRFGFTVRATGGSPAIAVKGTLPPGVTFTRHAGGTATLAGTPDRGALGLYHLTFTAKSGAGVATQAFTLTVDRAPRLGKLPGTLTLKLRQEVSIPITTTGYPVAQLLKTGHLPSALPLLDHGNGTGLIAGRVGPNDKPGRYRLTVIAANTSGDATHTITVLLVQAPAITSPRSAKVAIGSTLSFHVTGTGFPVPKITESGRLPKGVTFDSATATLKGIPRSGTKGSYKITFTAASSAGKATQAFTLTVT